MTSFKHLGLLTHHWKPNKTATDITVEAKARVALELTALTLVVVAIAFVITVTIASRLKHAAAI